MATGRWQNRPTELITRDRRLTTSLTEQSTSWLASRHHQIFSRNITEQSLVGISAVMLAVFYSIVA